MEIEKHFTGSFVAFTINESCGDGFNNNRIAAAGIVSQVREHFSRGHRKVALRFSRESHSDGLPVGVVTLLWDYFKKEGGGEIAVIESDPLLLEKWNPLISALGIQVLSSFEDLSGK